jgi:hypothetical protein
MYFPCRLAYIERPVGLSGYTGRVLVDVGALVVDTGLEVTVVEELVGLELVVTTELVVLVVIARHWC